MIKTTREAKEQTGIDASGHEESDGSHRSKKTVFAFFSFFALFFASNSHNHLLLPFDVGARGQVGVERLKAFGGGESGERDHYFFSSEKGLLINF